MKKIILILTFIITGCATEPKSPSDNVNGPVSDTEKLLSKGQKYLSQNNTKKAISEFSKALELCKGQYNNNEQKHYAARGQVEILYYMLKAASENISAVAVSTTCSDALYLIGYASLDLGKVEDAEKYLLRAVEMAPVNSMYLSELGHVYQIKRNWEIALKIFQDSENNVEAYSPPSLKTKELLRAKRGIGFVLIELGKLDEAEKKFRECLEIDENDKKALNELNYIKGLRSKKSDHAEL